MGSGSNDKTSTAGNGVEVVIGTEADAINHLYGLAPGEFVAARNQLVKAVRAAGERELATTIKALRKPSMVAAELNRVLRLDGEAVESLLHAAVALRDGHQSVLSGHDVDLATLQTSHRRAAADLAALAEHHSERLQALLESASLDDACHDDLRAAAYVNEPAPALGFDLFSPGAATAGPEDGGEDEDGPTATVSSISEARTRKRKRDAKAEDRPAENPAKSTKPAKSSDGRAEARAAKKRRAEAEAAVQDAASAHGKAEASLTLAYRQAEAAAKKHAKATERLAEAERQVSDAKSQLKKAATSLTTARNRSESAEEKLSSTADALREARARLEAETSADGDGP